VKKNILILLLALLVVGCDLNDTTSEMMPVNSFLIAKGNLYGAGEEGIIAQNLVITNQTTWSTLIAQMNSVNTVSNGFNEIDIDFSEYTIIAVFDDIKENGGHRLELNIFSNSETIMVNVTHLVPEGNATTLSTQPFHIVKILKSNLLLLFE
jgi:hypothetical protein